MIVAHHGGELPALVSLLSGGLAFGSVTAIVVRGRLGRLLRRPRRATRWRT